MEDNKRKLYDALSQDYDLGSFEQFSNDIADDTKRRKLFDATSEEYDFGDYDTFSSQLGFGKAAAPAAQPAETEQATPATTPAPEAEGDLNFDDEPNGLKETRAREERLARQQAVAEGTAMFNDMRQRKAQKAVEQAPTSSVEDAPAETRQKYADEEAAIKDFGRISQEIDGFDQRLADFNEKSDQVSSGKLKLSQDEFKKMQDEGKALADIAKRYDTVMSSAEGQEYKAVSERMNEIAKGEKTPESAWEYAQEYAKLQRNPVFRAAQGENAASEDEINAGLLQGQIAYLDEKMKSAKGDEKKELKKAFSDAKEALYANPWYKQHLASKIEENKAENIEIAQLRKARADEINAQYPGLDMDIRYVMQKTDSEINNFDAAARMHDDAIREYEKPVKYEDYDKNVGRGFGDWAKEFGTNTFGIERFVEDITVVRPVLEKVEKIVGNISEDAIITDGKIDELEKQLTPGELAVLDAYFEKVGAVAAKGADTAIGYQIGQGIGDMIILGVEMIATGGVGGVARKATEKGLKKAMVKLLGKRAYRKLAKSGAGRVALWAGSKITSDIVETAVRMPFMPSTYKNLGEKAVTLDEGYKTRSFKEYAPEAAWDQFVEQLTEVSNGFAFPLMGKVVKTPGMQKLFKETLGENGVRALRSFMERGDIKLLDDAMLGSFGGEWEEELLGAVIHSVTDDPKALSDFFSAEQQLVLLGTLAPLPISRGAVGGVQLAVPTANAAYRWNRAEAELKRLGLDEGRIARLKEVIDNAPVPEAAREIMNAYRDTYEGMWEAEDAAENDILRGTLRAAGAGPSSRDYDESSRRLYGELARYFWAAQQKRAVGLMGEIQADQKVAAKRSELEQNLGGTFYHPLNGEDVVEIGTLTAPDGSTRNIYVTSEQVNSNGELAYVGEDGSKGFVNPNELGDSRVVPVDQYLAGLVMQDAQVQEAEGVINEAVAVNQSLRQQVESLEEVTYQGQTGTISRASSSDEAAVFIPDDGENVVVPLEELAAENGIPVPEIVTQEENAAFGADAVVQRMAEQQQIADAFHEAYSSANRPGAFIDTDEGRMAVIDIIEDTINPEDGTAEFTVRQPDGTRNVTMRTSIERVMAGLQGQSVPAEEPAPATAEEPVTEQPAEEPAEEAPKIPVDKNGEKIYDAPGVSVEDALEDIYTTENITEEMADEYIRDMAAEAEKGRNPKRGKMNLAEWGKATAEANRKADFWKEMREFADANTAEREREQKEEAERQERIKQYGVDPATFDMTPQTVAEAVAEYLGNSEKLIDLDDAIRETLGRRKDNRVPRELFRHLGNGGILVKNGGRSVQDVANDIVGEYEGTLSITQDDVRTAIIDALLGKTKTELRDTIFDNRLNEAREAADMFSEEPAPVEEPAPAPVVEEPEPIPEPEPQPEPVNTPEGIAQEQRNKLTENGVIILGSFDEIPADAEPGFVFATVSVEEDGIVKIKFKRSSVNSKGKTIVGKTSGALIDVTPEDLGLEDGEGFDFDNVQITEQRMTADGRVGVTLQIKNADSPGFTEMSAPVTFDAADWLLETQLTQREQEVLAKNASPAEPAPEPETPVEEPAEEPVEEPEAPAEDAPAEEPEATEEQEPEQTEETPEKAEESEENPSESAGNSVTLEGEEEAREKFTDTVANRLIASIASGERPFKSITDLRKAAREAGMEVDERGATDILLQELAEVAIVRAARKFMSDFNGGLTSRNAFNAICRLYDMQPTISMRSSQRVAMQQYSTPLPMSFVAQMFAYKAGMQDVLEPTAGNGMLVFGIPADKVHANELDETRKANLDKQGFKEVTQNDATEPFSGEYQAVVANPPFGSHDAVEFDGKKISGLDPVITLRALDAMANNGRAAIIIGGNVEWGDNGGWKTKKAFFSYLYDHYNVKGVVNMAGDLYAKQGTSYPTMMILIDGKRSESDRTASTVYPPVRDKARGIATTNDELFDLVTEILNDKRKTDGNEVVRTERERKPADRSDQTGSLFAGDDSVESPSDGTDGGRGENGGGGIQSPRRNDVAGENRQDETVEGRPDGERPGSVRDVPAEEPGEVAERSADSGGTRVQGDAGRAGTDGRGSGNVPVGDAQREQPESVSGGEPAVREPVRVARKIKDKILSYIHHSRARSLESVAPAAMVEDMDASIRKIEKELGRTIDDFVTEELGYKSTEELHKALAAEQIDSVAMAIYQMKQGKAMIIGDQTGVGKGRQVAALIRWANRQGKKPVFMTQKAGLFSDIYRDLRDIGSGDLNPLILNSATMETDKETGEKHWSDTSGVMLDEEGNVKYRSPKSGLDKIIESGKVPDEYDFVVLTYSQLNNGDQQSRSESKKKVKDGTNPKVFAKAAFVRQIVNDNYILLDESHTAAGEDSNSGAFLRSVMPSVKGVTFSSATFAKRPDTMPLYAIKSAMSEANVEPNKLIAMIKKGGVTLQEIMSRALTRSGQMVRRERDMSDVKTDWKTVDDPATAKKARANYDRAIEIFNKIIQFQRNFITPVIDDISRDLAEVASSAGETSGTKNFGVDNPPFVSQTYNFTKQLMLALKADAIVDEVVKEIKAGRHPVIALENTYESGLDAYAVGDKIEDTSFSAGLLRSLGRILQYTVTDPDGNKSQEFLTPEELGPEAAKQYYALQDEIREATKGIFLSPLDLIKERLTGMGYNVGEVTGRKTHVVKEDDGYYRRERVADAKQAVRDFNSGASDVIIINKSGSTGISLHSSVAFKDQRPRSMIIAQPLGDINDYMQMIGRIDRTGQVHRGYYINLSLPVPAELRFNMMLAAKLKSLNANTTTSQESDTGSVEAPDFLNKYGSQVVIEYLRDNPDVFSKLVETGMKLGGKQNAVTTSAELENYRAMDEDIQKVTGRIALLPVEEQEKFYADISERYNTLIKYLDETGENTLKITTLPLKAKTLARRVGTEGKDPGGNNPFAQNSYVERVEVDVLRKPMKADEIRKVRENLAGGKDFKEYRDSLVDRVNEQEKARLAAEDERYAREKEKTQKEIDKQIAALEAKVKNMDEVTRKAEANRITNRLMANLEEKHQANVSSIKSMHRKLREKFEQFNTDDTYLIYEELEGGNLLEGENAYSPALFCGFKTAKAGENLTPSTSVAVFATLDGRRRLEIKFTSDAILDEISNFTNRNYWAAKDTTIDNWDSSISNASREERYILTGNILQAWDDATREGILPGRLVSYTDIDGNIHDGILMNQSWQPTQLRSSGAPINSRTEQILNGEAVRSTDGEVEIEHEWGDMFSIYVPKTKKAGAKYFENEDILSLIFRRQGFHQYRGRFTASVTRDNLRKLLDILGNMGVRVNTEENESAWEEVGQDTPAQQADEDGVLYRPLEDQQKIKELDNGKKVKVYRSMQVIDGQLYPPMSARVEGKLREPTALGAWEESEEHPEMADADGNFVLDKGNGKSLKAAYAPYVHTRRSPLNEQFSEAYNRPNLVIVEGEIPESELTSGYTAEGSKKAVGEHDWPSGKVSNALAKQGKNTRKVILSRWFKPIRIVPNSEVADIIAGLIGDSDISFPYNVVTPGLRAELQNRGIEFEGWQGNRPKNADSLIASMQPQFNRSGENLSSPIDRARAITTIDGIAKKLGVEFEQDSSLKAKGAFDPKTGKIRINIDAHKDTADLEATLLHEAVAHYGLRKLFGKDWKELRSRLYEQAAPEIKAKVDALAKADGLSTEVAMEEYIAQLAEDGRFDAQEESFWQRIVTALKRLLAKIGVNAGYLTDEDFRAMLYASYRNLQTGGALETAARVGVYQALRRSADASHEDNGPEDDGPSGNFRRWFGDSKVVDENGRPLVVYHGSRSTRDFSVFDYDADTDKSTGSGENPAFFFSDEDTAGVYKADVKLGTLYEGEGRMVPAYLSIQNPAEIDYEGANFRGVGLLAERYNYLTKQWEPFTNKGLRYFPNEREIISALRKRFPNRTFDIDVDYRFTKVDAKPPISEFVDGINRDEYDGAIIRNIDEVGKVTTDYVVFNSNQIKSAFGNNGEYSTEDPDIYNRDLSDLPEDTRDLAVEQETGELYRRNRSNATALTAAEAYNSGVRTVGQALREVVVDEYAPVDALAEALANESGKRIKDNERVSDHLREVGGKAMDAIRSYNDKFLRPMWDAVASFRKAAGDISIEDTETYIGLKSGLERNEVFAKRDAKRDYQQQYEDAIDGINAEEKEKKKALDKQLKTGAISDVTYQGELTLLQQEMNDKRDQAAAIRDAHFADVDAGTDERYAEYRKKDYSAITAWAETDDVAAAEQAASDFVNDMEQRAGAPVVKEMWKRVNAATKETLKFQYEHDMLTRDQYRDVSKMLNYYVPMRGFAEDTAEDLFNYYVTAQSNDFQPTILSAKGRHTMYEGPLGNIGAMHSSAISQGLKNQAKLSLLNLVRNRKGNTIATITRAWFVKTGQKDASGKDIYEVAYPDVPENATFQQRQSIIEQFEEDMKQLKAQGDAYNAHREVDLHGGVVAFEKESHKNEHIVQVREGGKEYGIIINGNPAAAQAINGVRRGKGAGERFLGIMRNWTRMLSQMFTTFSVPFWVSNFQRDFGQGLTNTFIRNDKEYFGKYLVNYARAFKVFPLIIGKNTMDNALAKGDPVAKLYQQYLENGGPMGQTRLEDNEYFEKQMQRYLDNSVKTGIIKGATGVLEAIGRVGEAVETVTRFAVFMTSMQSGRPLHQSISDAKEVSTNFARKGSGRSLTKDELDRMRHADGRPLNSVEKGFVNAISIGVEIFRATVPFFNAAVQGLENKGVNYDWNNQKQFWKTVAADSIYFMAGLGMMLLRSDDGGDDDKEKYSHTSDYLRRNNLLVGLGDGLYAKWALPQEYRVCYALGDIVGSAIKQQRPVDDLAIDAFGALMQLSPTGVISDEVLFSAGDKQKAWENLVVGISPGVAAPVFEAIFNRDFKGARLYNEGFNDNNRLYPGWTKALNTTGEEYVKAAETLNKLQHNSIDGLHIADDAQNRVERGLVNLNPAIVEHLVESYFSGPYQIVVRTPEAIGKAVRGEAKVRDIPLLNRLLLNANDNKRDAYYSNMYYYFKGLDTEASRIYSEYRKTSPEHAKEMMGTKEYQYMLIFKKYDKMEKQYRKRGKTAENEGDIETKNQMDEKIQSLHEQIAKECLDIYFGRQEVK